MSKIKIAFYAHSLDFSGTWRCHENLALNINRDLFDPYILYWPGCPGNGRLPFLKTTGIKLIPFERSLKKGSRDGGYTPISTNFDDVIKDIAPDILHVARAGHYEWPLISRMCPCQIETNVSGYRNCGCSFLDESILVSKFILSRTGYGTVLYNPVPPAKVSPSLRKSFNIPEDALVFGRIGRPEVNHNRAIDSLKYIQNVIPISCYLINLGSNKTNSDPYIIHIPPTCDDEYVSSFYNTIDIYLHAQLTGETFGCTIVEAMLHGIPVVSHRGTMYHGHIEVLGEGGVVVNDFPAYVAKAIEYGKNKVLRKCIGNLGKRHAQQFLIKNIVPKYEKFYLQCLKKR